MEFKKMLYKKAYFKAIHAITDTIDLLEAERIITAVNLHAVKNLKEAREKCEDIFINGEDL